MENETQSIYITTNIWCYLRRQHIDRFWCATCDVFVGFGPFRHLKILAEGYAFEPLNFVDLKLTKTTNMIQYSMQQKETTITERLSCQPDRFEVSLIALPVIVVDVYSKILQLNL